MQSPMMCRLSVVPEAYALAGIVRLICRLSPLLRRLSGYMRAAVPFTWMVGCVVSSLLFGLMIMMLSILMAHSTFGKTKAML